MFSEFPFSSKTRQNLHFMIENKFELQSYFILYLHFVIILSLSKDIVSYLHISNFFYSWTNVLLKNMVVYDVITFLQTMAFVCSTCGKAYSTNQNLARHSETHQDLKTCHIWRIKRTQSSKTRVQIFLHRVP